jgi:F0F1-type ATP synthase assembly protein I
MTQLTPVDLARILGHVTLILLVPMVGGTLLGLVIDAMLGTSPLLGVGGLVVGSLVAALGIWLYIRAHPMTARTASPRPGERSDGR